MARKLSFLKEPQAHYRPASSAKRALIVGNPTGDLPGAAAEAQAVANLLQQHEVEVDLLIGPAQVSANDFVKRLVTQWYDLVHYAGHGYFESADPRGSGLLFADGQVLAEELERVLKSAAFVFLSACEAAKSGTQKSTMGFRGTFIEGLATAVLLGGAIGCLAPMWEIDDGIAQDFAVEFYRHLFENDPPLPLGEVVRQARLSVRDQSPDFWATWVLYGGPLMLLSQVPDNEKVG